MKAQFVRHNENPLDTLEIGRIHERNIEAIRIEMKTLYDKYGIPSLNPYWTDEEWVRKEGQFTYGFYASGAKKEKSRIIEIHYYLESRAFYVLVSNQESIPKDSTWYTLKDALKEIKYLIKNLK